MANFLVDDYMPSLKLFVTLSKAYKTTMDKAVKDMKRHGVSPSEFMILEVLYHKGPIPLQQIGDKLLVTSGSVTYNIDKLEARGLLTRNPSVDDRRIIFATLTEQGRELFDHIFPKHAAVIHDLTSHLELEEKERMIELLKKLGKGSGSSR